MKLITEQPQGTDRSNGTQHTLNRDLNSYSETDALLTHIPEASSPTRPLAESASFPVEGEQASANVRCDEGDKGWDGFVGVTGSGRRSRWCTCCLNCICFIG